MQRPLPDELLCNVWIRSVRRAGLPMGAATQEMTGRKYYPGFFQGGHLADVAPWLGKSAERLLLEHTIFPYATAFHTEDMRRKCLAAALSTGRAARACGGLTQSVSELVAFRRWCPQCAEEDLVALGTSYWRRAQNLPGVLLCHVHGVPLLQSRIPTGMSRVSDLSLPHELRPGRGLAKGRTTYLMAVAKLSSALLQGEQPPTDGTPEGYRRLLTQLGLLSEGRVVSAASLVAAVARAAPLLNAFGLDPVDTWLPLMVRPRTGIPFVTAKHVAFQAALSQLRASRVRLDHVPTGCTKRPRATEDQAFAAQLRELRHRHVLAGTTTRISDALTAIGAWGAFRHDRKRYPLLSREVNRLRTSKASARRVQQVA